MPNSKKIVCFGEVLWDMLPTGKLPGGAPMNCAYHIHQLGLQSQMISRIGKDILGAELKELLISKKVDTSLLQVDDQYDTSTVAVTLDKKGTPSYEIVQPVAWDFIELQKNKEVVQQAEALIYGSLAARNTTTRTTLLQLLPYAPFKIFDINLRSPFYNEETLESLLSPADIVKMNEEEIEILCKLLGLSSFSEWDQMNWLIRRYQLTGLIITKGTEGALYFDGKKSYHQPIFKVEVQDTIGSGDAFLAGFTTQYIQGEPIPTCLQFGAFMGAYIASNKGAMPAYDKNSLFELYTSWTS